MWLLSNKVYVGDSGLLEGFRDCHCHLLPGVDDGVEEMNETLQILQCWEQQGVKEVWLTPHVMEDYPNEPAELKRRFEVLRDDIKSSIFNLQSSIHLAAENMLDGLFLKRLQADNLLTMEFDDNDNLNGNGNFEGKVLLVETSYYIPPMNMQQVIDNIKEKGYQPLLAHPERYQYMGQNEYRHWKQCGVLLQLNVPSLVGAYGPEVQSKAEWLLKKGFYDCYGTDIHSADQMHSFLSSLISKKIVRKIKS